MNPELLAPYIRIAARHGLVITIGLALALRLTILFSSPMIESDGIGYVREATLVSQGHWDKAFAKIDFTLYPVLMAWTHTVVSWIVPVSFETAGLLVNLACGIALLVPLYLLARRYFGAIPALAVGLYLAALPPLVYVTCNVLREGPFLCLVCWAFYLCITAIQSPDIDDWQLGKLSIAGLLVLLAALVRSEALGILACIGVAILFAHAKVFRHYSFHQRTYAIGTMLVLAFLCAAPILYVVQKRTGVPYYFKIDKLAKPYVLGTRPTSGQPSDAVSKNQMFRPDGSLDNDSVVHANREKRAKQYKLLSSLLNMLHASPLISNLALSLWDVFDATWKSCHGAGILAAAMAVWLLFRRRSIRLDDPLVPYFVATIVLYGAVCYRYSFVNFYLSTRHMMVVTLPMAILVAVPFAYENLFRPWFRKAFFGVVAVAAVMFVVESLRPKHESYTLERLCGKILADNLPTNAVVAAPPTLLRAAYYSQRAHFRFFVTSTNLPQESLSPDFYFLFNHRDRFQAACFAAISNRLVQAEQYKLPTDPKKYCFALYQALPPPAPEPASTTIAPATTPDAASSNTTRAAASVKPASTNKTGFAIVSTNKVRTTTKPAGTTTNKTGSATTRTSATTVTNKVGTSTTTKKK